MSDKKMSRRDERRREGKEDVMVQTTKRAAEWFFLERANGLSPSWWFTILASLVACGVSLYSWGLSNGAAVCLGGG